MSNMLAGIVAFVVFVSIGAAFATNDVHSSETGQGTLSSERDLKVEGFMKKTRVVRADSSIVEKLTAVKKKMKLLRQPERTNKNAAEGPQTLEEAAEYLRKHVSMAVPPATCTEYDGVFYFSGGTSTDSVSDFSSGFAVARGKDEISSWEKSAKEEK